MKNTLNKSRKPNIEDIKPETYHDGSGFVLTEFASGRFSWQGQAYRFPVNTERSRSILPSIWKKSWS